MAESQKLEAAPGAPKAESPAEQIAAQTAKLRAEVGHEIAEKMGGIKQEAEAVLEEPLDLSALKNDGNKLENVIDRLAAAWGGLSENLDKLQALFAPIGIRPSEFDPPSEAAGWNADTNEPPPPEWNGEITYKNWKRAEHARRKLDENPTWQQWIDDASKTWSVSDSIITAIIEMESGFNPDAQPIDKKTGETLSSAYGLSQALKGTFKDYQNEVDKDADRKNPKDAIEFVGWYCKHLMETVNNRVDTARPEEGFNQSFKLTPGNAKDLYLAYHEGPEGYLALRRYEKNQTPENFEKLKWWQKRSKAGVYDWKSAEMYATRVAQVAAAFENDFSEKAEDEEA